MGDPEVSHLRSTQTVKYYNDRKIDEAVQICNSCPVRQECSDDATKFDLFWTVRAGQIPTYYEHGSKTGPRRVPNSHNDEYVEYRCKSGRHEGDRYRGFKESWRKNGSKVMYCIACDHEFNALQRAKVV